LRLPLLPLSLTEGRFRSPFRPFVCFRRERLAVRRLVA